MDSDEDREVDVSGHGNVVAKADIPSYCPLLSCGGRLPLMDCCTVQCAWWVEGHGCAIPLLAVDALHGRTPGDM